MWESNLLTVKVSRNETRYTSYSHTKREWANYDIFEVNVLQLIFKCLYIIVGIKSHRKSKGIQRKRRPLWSENKRTLLCSVPAARALISVSRVGNLKWQRPRWPIWCLPNWVRAPQGPCNLKNWMLGLKGLSGGSWSISQANHKEFVGWKDKVLLSTFNILCLSDLSGSTYKGDGLHESGVESNFSESLRTGNETNVLIEMQGRRKTARPQKQKRKNPGNYLSVHQQGANKITIQPYNVIPCSNKNKERIRVIWNTLQDGRCTVCYHLS